MHKNNYWALKESIDVFFFDCDGTLSLIEGIDVLATMNDVAAKVHQITEQCMSKTGLTIEDYRQRLHYVQPTIEQLHELADKYSKHQAPGVQEMMQVLNYLNKKIYIISAGIKAAVVPFAQTLGLSAEQVLAVAVFFDEAGNYKNFDEASNMVKPHGKSLEIASRLQHGERSLLIGDGVSDLEAKETVTRFIGYGGFTTRASVRDYSDYYITKASFFAAIPLSLTWEEVQQLPEEYYVYYEQGITDIANSLVLMKESRHVCYSIT